MDRAYRNATRTLTSTYHQDQAFQAALRQSPLTLGEIQRFPERRVFSLPFVADIYTLLTDPYAEQASALPAWEPHRAILTAAMETPAMQNLVQMTQADHLFADMAFDAVAHALLTAVPPAIQDAQQQAMQSQDTADESAQRAGQAAQQQQQADQQTQDAMDALQQAQDAADQADQQAQDAMNAAQQQTAHAQQRANAAAHAQQRADTTGNAGTQQAAHQQAARAQQAQQQAQDAQDAAQQAQQEARQAHKQVAAAQTAQQDAQDAHDAAQQATGQAQDAAATAQQEADAAGQAANQAADAADAAADAAQDAGAAAMPSGQQLAQCARVSNQAAQHATAEAQQLMDALDLFANPGSQVGNPTQYMDPVTRLALAKKVQELTKFQSLVKMIGRMREIARTFIAAKTPSTTREIVGVMRGNDLPYLVPEEFVRLTMPQTRAAWVMDYVSEDLTQWEMDSPKDVGCGPIIVAFDFSGSMGSDFLGATREVWAKAVSLALRELAAHQRRDLRIIGFDTTVCGVWDAPKGVMEPAQLLSFICREAPANAGTKYEPWMQAATKSVQESRWKKADVLLLSDGEAWVAPAQIAAWNALRIENDMRVIAIFLGHTPRGIVSEICDAVVPVTALKDEGNAFKAVFDLKRHITTTGTAQQRTRE